MVIIKCNAVLDDETRRKLEINIHDQAADGVIVLPYFCELLNEVPADETMVIRYADGRPLFCSGCDYIHRYKGQTGHRLICPYHSPTRGAWTFCPNWPPHEEEAPDNG